MALTKSVTSGDMSTSTRRPPQRRRSLGSVSPRRVYRSLSVRLMGGGTVVNGETGSSRPPGKIFLPYGSLWDAVESRDTAAVTHLLSDSVVGSGCWCESRLRKGQRAQVNQMNEQGLVPLDVAVLTGNLELFQVLTRAGAQHNPVLCSTAQWAAKLDALVLLAEDRVAEWKKRMKMKNPQVETTRRLRIWTLRQQLYCTMRDVFHQTGFPDPPGMVSLVVTSGSSLAVSFTAPTGGATGLVTQYKVEWSSSDTFQPLCGSACVTDTTNLACSITGLKSGQHCFVRVSAYNIKGRGPARSSWPVSAVPSSWKECSDVKLRSYSQTEEIRALLEHMSEPQYRGYCNETSKLQRPSKGRSLSRSLKSLFNSTRTFVSALQRGVYLAAVFYHKGNVLVTPHSHLPVVEIHSCSTSITQDFLWFAKLSCAWQQVPWLQQALASSFSSSSSLLQSRRHTLQAVVQLQAALGNIDLGQAYYKPLRDRHGNVLLLTLKECTCLEPLQDPALHWVPFSRLGEQGGPARLLPEPTVLDLLSEQLKDKVSYHRRSGQWPRPGLYVGLLKLCSSLEDLRVVVPHKLPNLLYHARVRSSPHVTREEWAWLQSLSLIGGSVQLQGHMGTVGAHLGSFVWSLKAAVAQLFTKLSIPLHGASEYRVYTQELLQLGDKISLLLLLPSSGELRASPAHKEGVRDPGHTVPLQVFELVHFWAYDRDFLCHYCQAWVRLELDAHLCQQALREALDSREVQDAQERLGHITSLLARLNAVWRDRRWITDALQRLRSKHSVGTAPLGEVMREEVFISAPSQQAEGTALHSGVVCAERTASGQSSLSDDSDTTASTVGLRECSEDSAAGAQKDSGVADTEMGEALERLDLDAAGCDMFYLDGLDVGVTSGHRWQHSRPGNGYNGQNKGFTGDGGPNRPTSAIAVLHPNSPSNPLQGERGAHGLPSRSVVEWVSSCPKEP